MNERNACPACGQLVSETEERCPNCGLSGLNQMFLGKEDRNQWVHAVLNPHKRSLGGYVFAGGNGGALILLSNGSLYGYGNNSQGQYGMLWKDEMLDTPRLIEKNVRSAAVGYNYSLYVRADGSVVMMGNSGIAFLNRFPGFQHAKAVYAASDADVFWALDEQDRLYVWGDNYSWRVSSDFQKNVRTECYRCQPITITVRHYENISLFYETRYTQGTRYKGGSRSRGSDEYDKKRNIESSVKRMDEYAQCAKRYGEENLIVHIPFIRDEGVTSSHQDSNYQLANSMMLSQSTEFGRFYGSYFQSWQDHQVVYEPIVFRENRYLYAPIPANREDYLPTSVLCGNGLVKKKYLLNLPLQNARKICYLQQDANHPNRYSHQAVLTNDGSLHIYNSDGECLTVMQGIWDCSIAEKDIYLLTQNREFLRGEMENALVGKGIESFQRICGFSFH